MFFFALNLSETGKININFNVHIIILFVGQQWYFLSGRWLAKDEDDGQTEREIAASSADGVVC